MHNIKQLYSKHFGRAVVYTLLSLFLCMAGTSNASAAERNPVVKIDKTSYTSSGTEVTLRLWMFNYSNPFTNYSARFTGDVNLYIDDQVVIKLNSIWSSIAGAKKETIFTAFTDKPVDINIDGTNVGTAQFQDLKYGQTCPDNSNTTDNSWYTVDLKLSFNKSFSYYGHKITVKGKWQDKSSGSVVEKDVALDNTINGFVRPVNLKAQPSGSNMVFSWEQQGYNPSASTDGKWIVYKREGDNNVKLGEVAANEQSLSVENVLFSCSNDYIVAFLPDACKGAETVCGLTTSIGGKAHQINADDICQICGHSFFRYHTSDGNKVDISGKDFGAKVVSHKVIDSECVIEFDAPITRIPKQAFNNCKNLTGNLVIPNSVTEIGDQAFAGCTGFTGDLTIPNSVTNIGISAFYNCTGFTGNLTIPNSVTTIGDLAFYECTGFSGDLTILNSVKTIGNSAFYNCTGFKGKLTIPNSVTTIEAKAFANCYGFTGNLVIPESVTTIRASVFAGCNGFTGKLTIPNSVTTIGNLAFSGCKGFTGDLLLPKSLEAVGIRSFNKCYNIQTINFQSLPKGIDNLNKKTVSLSDDSYISDMARGTVNEISYTRTMTSNWGTLVLPYPLTLTGNEPYRLYSIDNMTGEELVLKQLEGVVAAGTPCVVKRNGSEAELTFGANKAALKMAIDDQPVGGMNFSGTYCTKDVTNGYIIAKDCFWNVEKLKGWVRLLPSRFVRSALGSTALLPMLLPNSVCASTVLLLVLMLLIPSTMPKQNTTTSAASVSTNHSAA
ncbi:leucine-rich repeat protein [uncultured Prevotella sp.]|mgnify:CR=1 FL=1|uniref:leucine-rich repeat domain-containing protein n=1 Tax=uncultured Prevotella sp. TaxID=159272 RepID=UPI0027E2B64B|nr:leucine-rich repeat protein [uncultured Prevotella sp.]